MIIMETDLIFSLIIISIAFFCESIFGFGGGLISIPLLSLFLGVKEAVTLILIFQLLMGLLIIKTHKEIDWKIARPMTVGLIIGTLVGTYMLSIIPASILRTILAISIFFFLLKMTLLKGFTFGKEKKWGFVAGLLGGWFQGIIGTGGPVFTMYLTVTLSTKSVFRATLIYLFFITSVIRFIASVPTGLITSEIIFLAVPVIPFFLVAIFLGHKVHKRIPEKHYRYAVEAILFFAAISMLIKK